ncbi:type II toxin-antitoxin system HipA family toxin [Asticcacaulis sp. EMRT-3]|uniref:type II toxin-antitoxin system HipA family toxin n=1 Tax=Asticcacaulis sp. EMRT-3 TaxID=3040349 RepID=UPI0024AF1D86|nr:type II toxin-antitoxin system HipA family toxin [Asticcacaulis sp. EMRT-3]MDI7776597.1 type II toxin-antitoxin system HipA family toxin [Asticcacaulis sp. EMRT-3]
MAGHAAILGVHLLGPANSSVRVGTLSRDATGTTAFVVDEAYLQEPNRPIMSLSWLAPDNDMLTQARLANRGDKIGLHGYLAPWFSGLLPEGALRQLVMTEMGAGNHDQFDLIARLGADLPGAVMVIPETELPASVGPMQFERVHGFRAPKPEGVVKFSLAGVQLKFTANPDGDRLTVPGRDSDSRCILKVASDQYPGLPEAEHAAMHLAGLAGVTTAHCRLISTNDIQGVPAEFLQHGETVLCVDRFDRGPDSARIHIEDIGQVIGAVGEHKYTMANYESILNTIKRFSSDWRIDVMEGFRRSVVDVLIGNGDNHLKNWSFIFPAPGIIRLSPAYDIVPTVLYVPNDQLALELAGTRAFESVTFKRISRIARFLQIDPDRVQAEMKALVRNAVATWPDQLVTLLGNEKADRLIRRFDTLSLVQEALA